MWKLIKKVSNAMTRMGCRHVSWGRRRGGHRDDVRNNTTTKGIHLTESKTQILGLVLF